MPSKPVLPPIVVDTREQLPWSFPVGIPTVSKALPVGDYSLVGHETEIAVERKSLQDFIGSISHDRERFLRELEKLKSYVYGCVVIEGTLQEVTAKMYKGATHWSSVVGSAVAISLDYCPVVWAGDRYGGATWAFRLLKRYWHKRVAPNKEAIAQEAEHSLAEVSVAVGDSGAGESHTECADDREHEGTNDLGSVGTLLLDRG